MLPVPGARPAQVPTKPRPAAVVATSSSAGASPTTKAWSASRRVMVRPYATRQGSLRPALGASPLRDELLPAGRPTWASQARRSSPRMMLVRLSTPPRGQHAVSMRCSRRAGREQRATVGPALRTRSAARSRRGRSQTTRTRAGPNLSVGRPDCWHATRRPTKVVTRTDKRQATRSRQGSPLLASCQLQMGSPA